MQDWSQIPSLFHNPYPVSLLKHLPDPDNDILARFVIQAESPTEAGIEEIMEMENVFLVQIGDVGFFLHGHIG